jgi:NADPH:quinone reductase-like Zn-dependent oxidoreductase
MRAVVQDRYGPPEEALRVAEVERRAPKEDEVLVRVHASTVTRGDAMGVRHVEYRFVRLFTGIRRPRRTTCGSEFAGRVEEVGATVKEFRSATRCSASRAARTRNTWSCVRAARSHRSRQG